MVQLGKVIYNVLSGDTTVSSYVSTKIYPLVIPENTTLPCIVYERSSDYQYTRDGAGISNSVVEVTVLSEDYTEAINISQAVYNKLQMYSGTSAGIQIVDCRLINLAETYAENAFIQKLTFEIKSI